MRSCTVYPGKTIKEPESAWYYSTIFNGQIYNVSTGGGFSNVYPIPKYQSSAVATYFKDHNPPYPHYSRIVNDTGDIQTKPDIGALAGSSGGIYNRIGRGIPDVAANAYNTAVCLPSTENVKSSKNLDLCRRKLWPWRWHFCSYAYLRCDY